VTVPTWPLPPGLPGLPGRPDAGGPAGGSTDWADSIRGRLFEHRTILLRGTLDDAVANQAAAELMTLDATGDSRITLHVDLAGGSLEAAFTVMDVIDLVGVPVHVLCSGRAEGAAVGVVAVAGRRAAAPHARFRLADPEGVMSGSATDLSRWADHHLAQLHRFHERIAAAVKKPAGKVAADFDERRYLTAAEALRYGLIDEIAAPKGAVYPLPERTVGFRSDDRD
jgi:ATP-dependent Clp protease, protease subunit